MEAHVVPRKGKSADQLSLLAYVKLKAEPVVQDDVVGELREDLKQNLPPYMIPDHFITVDKFPLNKNGKLDRSQLPAPPEKSLQPSLLGDSAIESDEIDRDAPVVAFILLEFADELGYESAKALWHDRHKSFFEVGGTSLSAVQATRKISEVLSIEIKVTDLIQQPTILAFVIHVTKMVEQSRETRASSADDLNISATGVKSKQVQGTVNWVAFRVIQIFAMIAMLALSVIIPIAAGLTAFFAVLDTVGFPIILPLLPAIYGIVALSNLAITSFVFACVSLGKKDCYPASFSLTSLQFVAWTTSRRMSQITSNLFWFANGSKVMSFVYRMLGAQIGYDVTIDNVIVDMPR